MLRDVLISFMRLTVLVLGIFVGMVYSQHDEGETASSHVNEHAIHWNHIAVFIGATSKFEKEGTHFSIGLDYVRRLPPTTRWDVSVFGEAIFEKHTEWLFGIPLIYWPSHHIWLRTGPGIEILLEEEHHHTETITETTVEFLWRLGIGYEIEFGNYVLSPSIDLDFGRSTTAMVWGLNFGYGF